ncbi:peptidase S10 [Tsuneonella flava]|uniref:Peptidase S10 n=1 Tax=Tsuneonella flava TaxID=2055955 RepID=A0ABX7KBH3_9SPHN|nr:peptidase S10 [Tsuneonella flava]QSB45332.1 peptidase S10 [Tsuneonella flava]
MVPTAIRKGMKWGMGCALIAAAFCPLSLSYAAAHSDSPKQGEGSVQPVMGGSETRTASRGTITIGGRTVAYTANAGTLTIRDDYGDPIASIFYAAYVADRKPGDPERPLTFLFNGGPGSASMFLHLGSVAPVRIAFPHGPSPLSPPYRIASNPYSLIDRTDMVFLDMVGAGYSRPLGKAKDADFWSVDSDIDAFARAIRRYLTVHNRWNSPTYLFGESYGTTRASGLAYKLAGLSGGGVRLSGVVLLGVNLNHGIYQPGFDESYIQWLPSFAATAWYHNRLAKRPPSLEPWLTQVRAWARGPYAAILAKGHLATDAERRRIAREYSAFTGISERDVLDANLRIEQGTFRKLLLKDRGLTVGRLDSRVIGQDASNLGDVPDYDAAGSFNAGPFGAGINHYLTDRLGFRSDVEYRPNIYSLLKGRWDRSHVSPSGNRMALANTAEDLARTMRQNRQLKVLILNGYYDLATPFFKAEYDIAHMQIDRELQRNIRFEYFESGHMIYTETGEMPALRDALDRFYRGATPAEMASIEKGTTKQ